MARHIWIGTAAALVLASFSAGAEAQRARGRFAGLDRDGDGVITRAEWRGSQQSFAVHDWNHDGVLSGDELLDDAQDGRTRQERSVEFGDWTRAGFEGLDVNRDGAISQDEWPFNWDPFHRADRNSDGVVTRVEFLNAGGISDDRARRSGDESARFESLDSDRDGVITLREWRGSRESFDRRDADGNGVLSRDELRRAAQSSVQREQSQRPAYTAGAARGLAEGRAAGREDRERNQGWDLEGQRELEQADSGYSPNIGAREDYQAGYREAFRRGYREGYGPRQ